MEGHAVDFYCPGVTFMLAPCCQKNAVSNPVKKNADLLSFVCMRDDYFLLPYWRINPPMVWIPFPGSKEGSRWHV
jgi:hypothetical protein